MTLVCGLFFLPSSSCVSFVGGLRLSLSSFSVVFPKTLRACIIGSLWGGAVVVKRHPECIPKFPGWIGSW